MAVKITCFDVAEYFLRLAHKSGSLITNLKLQKLVYYAQAWHLANFGEPIFDEEFEAWIHGPVVYKLWNKYRSYRWNPITAHSSDPGPAFPAKTLAFLGKVAQVYMPVDAYALELMTHKEAPWVDARTGLAPDQNGHEVISKDAMRKFFGKRLGK